MASDPNLSVHLRAIDNLTAPLRRLNSQLEAMQAPARRLGATLNRSLQLTGVSQIGAGLRDIGKEASALWVKLSALGVGAGFLFKTQFIDVAAEMENLKVALDSIEGSAEKGRKSFMWITDFAKKTPLEIGTTMQAFINLRTAGIDPMNGSLMSLVDVNAKMNGSQENFLELTNQLTQAWMKGKLLYEEVRIIQSRGIPVTDLLAKSMGKTTAKIIALMEKGKIGRKEIALLFKTMGENAAGAAEKQSRTWTGMMSTLSDTWKGFVTQLMNSGGSFSFLKQNLDAIIKRLEFLQTPEGLKEIDHWGKKLRETLEAIVKFAGEAWEGIRELSAMVGGFGNLAKITFTGISVIMAGPLLLAITQLATGIGILGAALIANPIALTIMAIVAAIEALAYAIRNWDSIKRSVGNFVPDLFNKIGIDLKRPAVTGATGAPLKPLAIQNAKVDAGGLITLKVEDDRIKTKQIKSNNPSILYKVDTGLLMSGAY